MYLGVNHAMYMHSYIYLIEDPLLAILSTFSLRRIEDIRVSQNNYCNLLSSSVTPMTAGQTSTPILRTSLNNSQQPKQPPTSGMRNKKQNCEICLD